MFLKEGITEPIDLQRASTCGAMAQESKDRRSGSMAS